MQRALAKHAPHLQCPVLGKEQGVSVWMSSHHRLLLRGRRDELGVGEVEWYWSLLLTIGWIYHNLNHWMELHNLNTVHM